MSLGVIESFTAAMGEMLNDFCGLRMTRLLTNVAVGDVALSVERSYDWPDAGAVSIDGAVYHYTANDGAGALTGVYYLSGGVEIAGTKGAHLAASAVIDVSQSYSALDQVRQAMLVETAAGDDLSALGRNLGVLRLPQVNDDDVFRNIVMALAYNPKGTIYGLELAMDALVGVGNYTIFEDLVNFPCTVFIYIPGSLALANVPQGQAWLTARTRILASAGALTYAYGATTNATPYVHVASVLLADPQFTSDVRLVRPSTPLDNFGNAAWAWTTGSETSKVVLITSPEPCCEIRSGGRDYSRNAQITPASTVTLRLTCSLGGNTLNSTDGRLGGRIRDGVRDIAWGVMESSASTYSLGLINMTTGAFIAGTVVRTKTTFVDITLVKNGTGAVSLLVDGAVVQTAAYTDFVTTSTVDIRFGVLSTTLASNYQFRFKQVSLSAHTDTDYWSARGVDGQVATATPTRLTVGTAVFAAGDVGKQVRISGSAITNAQGGNNNAVMQVATYVDTSNVTLVSASGTGAQVDAIHPTRVTVTAPRAFRYPDDLGKTLTISNSALGNNGTYVIATLLDPTALTDLSLPLTRIGSDTNVCQVTGASFVPETGLTYALTPVFSTETGLTWELADAGTLGAPTGTNYPLTTRQALPIAAGYYDVLVTTVRSAQVLDSDAILNALTAVGPPATFTYWPFYLTDPYYVVQTYIDTIVAAGIRAVFFFT